jgi:hypothetical protein
MAMFVRRLNQWLIVSFTSVILGLILGYSLGWIWFFFRLFFLGYGDSGPGWINTVNNLIFMAGILAGIVGGQILFFQKIRE